MYWLLVLLRFKLFLCSYPSCRQAGGIRFFHPSVHTYLRAYIHARTQPFSSQLAINFWLKFQPVSVFIISVGLLVMLSHLFLPCDVASRLYKCLITLFLLSGIMVPITEHLFHLDLRSLQYPNRKSDTTISMLPWWPEVSEIARSNFCLWHLMLRLARRLLPALVLLLQGCHKPGILRDVCEHGNSGNSHGILFNQREKL